jgi:hypothetical protein
MTCAQMLGTLFGCLMLSMSASAERTNELMSGKIERLLAADRAWQKGIFIDLSRARAKTGPPLRNLPSPMSMMNSYIQAHRNLDLMEFPQKFRRAYLEHIQAWEKLSLELQHAREGGGRELLLGVVELYYMPHLGIATIGDGLAKSGEAEKQNENLKNVAVVQIVNSWHQLELEACDCGARVTGPIPHGTLGVVLGVPNDAGSNPMKATPVGELQVLKVIPNSAADRHGLLSRDIVTSVDNVKSSDPHVHVHVWLITTKAPGERVAFSVRRGSTILDFSPVLDSDRLGAAN